MSFFGVLFLAALYTGGLANYLMAYRGFQRSEYAYSILMLVGGIAAHGFIFWALSNMP